MFAKRVSLVLFFFMMSLYASVAVDTINRERVHCGMTRLRENPSLKKAAYNHSRYLSVNRTFSHNERRGRRYFTGTTPFDRIVAAGYGTRVGIENISFGERDFGSSIKKLFRTVYHRLAFLDMQVDEIGAASYGRASRRVYVYDMGVSDMADLCRKTKNRGGSGEYARNICRSTQKIDKKAFYSALDRSRRRNPAIVVYPYPGQTGVPRSFAVERPNPPSGKKSSGFPITVQMNQSRYRNPRLKYLKLYDSDGKIVKSRVFSSSNDPNRKMQPGTFAMIPLRRLRANREYIVRFSALSGGKTIKKEWRFKTATK